MIARTRLNVSYTLIVCLALLTLRMR